MEQSNGNIILREPQALLQKGEDFTDNIAKWQDHMIIGLEHDEGVVVKKILKAENESISPLHRALFILCFVSILSVAWYEFKNFNLTVRTYSSIEEVNNINISKFIKEIQNTKNDSIVIDDKFRENAYVCKNLYENGQFEECVKNMYNWFYNPQISRKIKYTNYEELNKIYLKSLNKCGKGYGSYYLKNILNGTLNNYELFEAIKYCDDYAKILYAKLSVLTRYEKNFGEFISEKNYQELYNYYKTKKFTIESLDKEINDNYKLITLLSNINNDRNIKNIKNYLQALLHFIQSVLIAKKEAHWYKFTFLPIDIKDEGYSDLSRSFGICKEDSENNSFELAQFECFLDKKILEEMKSKGRFFFDKFQYVDLNTYSSIPIEVNKEWLENDIRKINLRLLKTEVR